MIILVHSDIPLHHSLISMNVMIILHSKTRLIDNYCTVTLGSVNIKIRPGKKICPVDVFVNATCFLCRSRTMKG